MDHDTRILSAAASFDDPHFDASLRPERLEEYVGQQGIKANLDIFLQAARGRKECLDHVLLFGPPGLGKTTLAHIIAREMEAPIRVTSGPVIEKAGDLAAILTNIEPGEVLFIDEIHRLGPAVEEILYPALEDFRLDLVIGQGPAARTVTIEIPRFTLIAATTRAGLITAPLRARFGIVHRLHFYEKADLQHIVNRSGRILNIDVDSGGAEEIARRSRGTPRVANRLLRRVRDFAQVKGDGRIDHPLAKDALSLMEVDEFGFDEVDRRILTILIDHYDGGPAGINALAAAVGEDRGTIEDLYEPFLIQEGFLKRTSRGRVASDRAYRHLGFDPPKRNPTDQTPLF